MFGNPSYHQTEGVQMESIQQCWSPPNYDALSLQHCLVSVSENNNILLLYDSIIAQIYLDTYATNAFIVVITHQRKASK